MKDYLKIKKLQCRYEKSYPVLKNLNLEIKESEIVVILGESGSGKSTLLRCIAGLQSVVSGSVSLEGNLLNHIPINKRKTALMFQSYALFPHLNVKENILFGVGKTGVNDMNDLCSLLNISELQDRFPDQISGGQQQRVALARTLITNPKLLMMDEPFSNIDHVLKNSLREEIFSLIRKRNLTCIMVSHDIEDAWQVADRVAIMENGQLVQIGTASELYERPKTEYVAKYMGPVNLISGTIYKDKFSCDLGEFCFTKHDETKTSDLNKLLIRPSDIGLLPDETGDWIVKKTTSRGRNSDLLISNTKHQLLVSTVNKESDFQCNQKVTATFPTTAHVIVY